MNFTELINKINNYDLNKKEDIINIVNEININQNNFNQWVNNIFSNQIKLFNMEKLPYLIDELYKSNDKGKFMLCCMLLEASCNQLAFITNLETYPLFQAKFETLLNTLVTVYDRVDNGIADCMALIILNNDPQYKMLDDNSKNIIINATKRKLQDIINYLKTPNINPAVYETLEIIIDMACHLNNQEINNLIEELDKLPNNNQSNIFIIKYKLINQMPISNNKLLEIKKDNENISLLYSIMKELNVHNLYLNDITQEQIAKSEMIRWLKYPTELGDIPDKIELLGEFIFNNTKCYAYVFSKENFAIKGDLLGVSGGYPLDKISNKSTGYTFSKFEPLSNNWQQQAVELVEFIYNYWKNRSAQ
jgi:hypothetical protein